MTKNCNNIAEEKQSTSHAELFKIKLKELTKFLTYDIWRQNPKTLSNKKNILYNAIKTAILTIKNIQEQNIPASARSLTYRTILSLVPLLAILFAIARGFGIENILENAADVASTESTHDFLFLLSNIVNESLDNAQGGGIFAGIGILLFLYTIIILFVDIEDSFNKIWQVTKSRSWRRKASDYLAFILLMPILFLLANAINFINFPDNTWLDTLRAQYPFLPRLLDIITYTILLLSFTFLYAFMPNTKVKFINALIAGVIAGTTFFFFQMFFLNGFLWITHYNAIYGTFAAIPLLLMWIHASWFIVLVGAEISYAAQNIPKFSFEKETKNISRRYKDFFTLMITSVIVKRFAQDKTPLTADEISERCKAPARLTNHILSELQKMKIISPTPSFKDERIIAYLPALDINQLSVNYLFSRLDKQGSEDFNIEMEGDFQDTWSALIDIRKRMYEGKEDILLKNL